MENLLRFHSSITETRKLIGECAKKSRGKNAAQAKRFLDTLYSIARMAMDGLRGVSSEGNQYAITGMLRIIEENLSALDEMCHSQPKLFEPIARHKLYWPAFVSEIKGSRERNLELLKLIQLGKDFGLNTSKHQPDWDAEEIKIAMWLHRVAIVRNSVGKVDSKTGKLVRTGKLSVLNKNNYKDWFKASWPIFVIRYGSDFENQKCFSHLISSAEKSSVTASKKRRGILRKFIKNKILLAFKRIAAKVE